MNQKENSPSFYLISGERSDPRVPTACWPIGRLRDSSRDDYMLVSISPAIVGQKYSLGSQNIDQLVLSTRLSGTTLFPIQGWPCHVYVMRIKNDSILASHFIEKEDVEMIGWGTLHPTEEDARRVEFTGPPRVS
jgi:hypothetical protein